MGASDPTAGRSSFPWALVSLSLSMLLSSLGTSIANVALPALADAFGGSFQDVQWIVLAYLLAVTTLIVSVGRLGDMTGRRRLLLGGILLYSAASLLAGLAPSLVLLIAARAAQGLGAAIMMALTMAFVGETVPKEKTGSAMGLLGTMSAVGTALGPSLGGVLISAFGWRSIFFVTAPLGLAGFLLARRFLPGDRRNDEASRASFDYLGTALLALALAAYALAMTLGRGRFGALNGVLLSAAVAGAGLFVFVQGRTMSPLIKPAMLRDPLLWPSLAMSTLVVTVMMSTLIVGPFYLSRTMGLEPALVGLVLSIGPAIAAVAGFPSGAAVDRFGAGRVTLFGLAAIAAGSIALSALPTSFGLPAYIGPVAVMTAGFALFQASNNTSALRDVHPTQRGVVSGMLNLSRNLGLITGASLMGAIFVAGSGASEVTTAAPDAVARGMRLTFAVASVLMLGALAIGASHVRTARP